MPRRTWFFQVAISIVVLVAVAACSQPAPGGGQAAPSGGQAAPTAVKAAATSAPAAATSAPAAAAKGPIKLGAHIPLTGASADAGQRMRKGYELAIKQANDAGGIGGAKLELFVEDDRSDVATTRSAIAKLATENNVVGILGTYGSGYGVAGAEAAERYKIPNIQPFTSSPTIVTSGWKYVLNTTAPDNVRWKTMLDYFGKANLGKKWAGIVIEGNNPAFTAFDQAVKDYGAQQVVREFVGTTQNDFQAVVTKLLQAKPDMFIYTTNAAQSVVLHRQLKQLKADIPFVMRTTSLPNDPELVTALQKDVNYIIGMDEWYPGINTPGNKEFEASFKAAYGTDATRFESKAFAAAQDMLAAIKAVGPNSDAINDWMHKNKVDTVAGPMVFDEKGQRSPAFVIAQMLEDKLMPVWPDNMKAGTAKPAPPWDKR